MKYRSIYLIGLALAIKMILFYLFWKCHSQEGRLYVFTGDSKTYIAFTENLLDKGSYYVTFDDSNQKYYTFRMPGIMFFYLPLRLVFNKHIALSIFVVLQTLLSALSTYYLAKLAVGLTGYSRLFWPVFILASICPYTANYNNLIMSESFALSFFIFSLYLITNGNTNATKYILSGLCFGVVIFLRPFMAPFLLILAVLIYSSLRPQKSAYIAIKNVILFLIPFALLDGIWVVRNLFTVNQFVPLQTSVEWYKGKYKSREAMTIFIQAHGFPWMGQDGSPWHWLTADDYEKPMQKDITNDNFFPARTFSNGLTYDTLKAARKFIVCTLNEKLDSLQRKYCDEEAARLLNKFTDNLKSTKPLDYFIINRLRITLNFLHQPHSVGYPTKNLTYRLGWIVNKVDTIINYYVVFAGIIGLLVRMPTKMEGIIFTILPTYIIFLFCWIFRVDEHRFLVMAYPFLLINSFLPLLYLGVKAGFLKK